MNWKYYDTSILEFSSSTGHNLFSNYSSTYITNFKEKLRAVQQSNFTGAFNDDKHPVCFALFYPLFAEPVWVSIGCNVILKNVYFICEFPIRIKKRSPIYYRPDLLCHTKYIFAAGKCWEIVQQSATATRPSSGQLKKLQHHLAAWSFGHNSRKIIGIRNYAKQQCCLKTHSFQFYRLKTFIESTDCGNTKPNYTLVSRNISTYSFICDIKSQHICDLKTCILNTYLCDGKYDCFDKSDEDDCTAPLTSYTLVCTDNRNESCGNQVLTYNGCADLYYECFSGECVPLAYLCDHHSHCADNSDEIHCTSLKLKGMTQSASATKVGFISDLTV